MKLFAYLVASATLVASDGCMSGWVDNGNGCYPENAELTCSQTGLTLQMSLSDMYENPEKLTSDQKLATVYFGEDDTMTEVGNFEAETIQITKTWSEIADNLEITQSDGSIKFQVKVSADQPGVTFGNDVIFLTQTASYYAACQFSDTVEVTLDGDVSVNVQEHSEDGTLGEDISLADSFILSAFHATDNQEITEDLPIALGDTINGQITADSLFDTFVWYVEYCKVSESSDKITEISLFDQFDCFNPVFGSAETIFNSKSHAEQSTTQFDFSFPAFTFDNGESDNLHLVSYKF